MKDYDLLQPVPQGSDGAQTEENRRIAEVADELRRLCQLHETQHGAGGKYVEAFEIALKDAPPRLATKRGG